MTPKNSLRQRRNMLKRRQAAPEALEEGRGRIDDRAEPGSVPDAAQIRKRCKDPLGWMILALLMGWRPMELLALPGWVTKPAVLLGLTYVCHRFATFTRWGDELKHVRKFILIICIAIVQLLIENYCSWVVAASNKRKYDPTDVPLQDNVAIFFRNWMQMNSAVKWLVTWRWCSISNLLMVFLCMTVANVWDQIPYSGFAVASRALLMHCTVRVVRTIGFLAVVIPHPKHTNCYAGKFPPVPDTMYEYILAGMAAVRGSGGCNDLIMSGHACTWMMAVASVWTYYPNGVSRYVLVLAYIQTALRTAVEGWHYSVDFILPPVVSWFMWKDFDWMCPLHTMIPVRKPGDVDPVNKLAVSGAFLGIAFGVVCGFFIGG